MTALMQHTSPRMSSWVSLQQGDAQTTTNETERKSQTLNTQSSSLKVVKKKKKKKKKVVKQTYLSSADAARAPIAVFDLEMSW